MALDGPCDDDDDVTPEMRAQLAAISNTFTATKGDPLVTKGNGVHFEALPAPNIRNGTTHFLALDKVNLNRDFLQLMEVDCLSAPPTRNHPHGNFKLSYDKEWLAILRTFADELELGGKMSDPIPAFKSPDEYHSQIDKELRWVEKNVVQEGRMRIPHNFVQTAPIYDPNLRISENDQPREYTNPQTAEFCALLDLENKFDFSEADRDERMACGPDEYNQPIKFRGRGGRRGTNAMLRMQEAQKAGVRYERSATRNDEMHPQRHMARPDGSYSDRPILDPKNGTRFMGRN